MGNASSRGFAQGRPTCAPPARTLEVRKGQDTDPLKQYPPSPDGYGGTGVWDLRYIDAPVLRWRDGNTDGTVDDTLYYCNDANMNPPSPAGFGETGVTAVVDASDGDVVERYAYDPYGKVTVLNGEDDADGGGVSDWSADVDDVSDWDNRILYCGYRLDPETGADGQGIMHVRHRPYIPPLGRWGSRDPLNQDQPGGGYHDGMGLYAYVGSVPIGAMDPRGLLWSGLGRFFRAVGHDFKEGAAAVGDLANHGKPYHDPPRPPKRPEPKRAIPKTPKPAHKTLIRRYAKCADWYWFHLGCGDNICKRNSEGESLEGPPAAGLALAECLRSCARGREAAAHISYKGLSTDPEVCDQSRHPDKRRKQVVADLVAADYNESVAEDAAEYLTSTFAKAAFEALTEGGEKLKRPAAGVPLDMGNAALDGMLEAYKGIRIAFGELPARYVKEHPTLAGDPEAKIVDPGFMQAYIKSAHGMDVELDGKTEPGVKYTGDILRGIASGSIPVEAYFSD